MNRGTFMYMGLSAVLLFTQLPQYAGQENLAVGWPSNLHVLKMFEI